MPDPGLGDPAPESATDVVAAHPHAFLAGYGILGFALTIAATWLFLVLADEIPEKGWMVRLDTGISGWIQAHGTETGESIFTVVSLFGAPLLAVILFATAVTLVRHRRRLCAAALVITTGGGVLLNAVLKRLLHRDRPLYASEFHARSWSFPSGHAMASVIGYGFLALLLIHRNPERRAVIVAAAATIILTIGFARVYLGVHYPSDVLGGYCAGAVWLTVCIKGFRRGRACQ